MKRSQVVSAIAGFSALPLVLAANVASAQLIDEAVETAFTSITTDVTTVIGLIIGLAVLAMGGRWIKATFF